MMSKENAKAIIEIVSNHQVKQKRNVVVIDNEFWTEYETVCKTCGVLKSKSDVTHIAEMFQKAGLNYE